MVVEVGLSAGGRRRLDETGKVVKVAATGLERAAQGTHGGEHLAVDVGRQQADQLGQRGAQRRGLSFIAHPQWGSSGSAGATMSLLTTGRRCPI